MDKEQNNAPEKKSKKVVWISLVIGILMIIVGGTTLIDDDLINDALVELGAQQTAISSIELNPDTKEVYAKVSEVLTAAVHARTSDPEELAKLINDALVEYAGTSVNVTPIINALLNKLNELKHASPTEEIYLHKVALLAKGFKEAVESSK